jgi:hypothetical protein
MYAQKNNVINFQKEHPEISFISLERFNSLSAEEITLFADNFVVFNSDIQSTDLSKFNFPPKLKSSDSGPINGTDESSDVFNQIKNWYSTHTDVKIVKRSEYNELSEANKIIYTNNHYLILIGETLTFLDTQLYPY